MVVMAKTRIPADASGAAPSRPHESPPQASSARVAGKRRRLSPFWRHFMKMLAAMVVTGAIFLSIVGLKTWDEVTVLYPTQALLAMAAGMTTSWATVRSPGSVAHDQMPARSHRPRRVTEDLVRGIRPWPPPVYRVGEKSPDAVALCAGKAFDHQLIR
jgi:hypothetical protein